jgi:thymidylate synthase (FAD)
MSAISQKGAVVVARNTAVSLISITPNAEYLIAYCARVSSANQENPEYAKLFAYLLKHSHWSPFEMAHMVLEINTSRAIAAQLLRHKSFSFQEFSQRYSDAVPDCLQVQGRLQSNYNRQSSVTATNSDTEAHWQDLQREVYGKCVEAYRTALSWGIAREQARMLLPLATGTRMYMAGSLRSWIHYVQLRTQQDTQLEHRTLALTCKSILTQECPTLGALL